MWIWEQKQFHSSCSRVEPFQEMCNSFQEHGNTNCLLLVPKGLMRPLGCPCVQQSNNMKPKGKSGWNAEYTVLAKRARLWPVVQCSQVFELYVKSGKSYYLCTERKITSSKSSSAICSVQIYSKPNCFMDRGLQMSNGLSILSLNIEISPSRSSISLSLSIISSSSDLIFCFSQATSFCKPLTVLFSCFDSCHETSLSSLTVLSMHRRAVSSLADSW